MMTVVCLSVSVLTVSGWKAKGEMNRQGRVLSLRTEEVVFWQCGDIDECPQQRLQIAPNVTS